MHSCDIRSKMNEWTQELEREYGKPGRRWF